MAPEEFHLAKMNRDQVKRVAKRAVLLVPLATVEQHGPHLALHCDTDNVTHMARGVAERLNPRPRVLVSPTFWQSPSPFEPADYPGCTAIRKEVFIAALNDVLEGYLRGGFTKIVVINGHGGGPERWLPGIVDRLNEERTSLVWPGWKIPDDARVISLCWWVFLGEFASEQLRGIPLKGTHAGEIETSLQLYLHPELVDMKKAKRGFIKEATTFGRQNLFESQRAFVIDGYPFPPKKKGLVDKVWGDPTKASREFGEKLFKLAVDKLSEMVTEFDGLWERQRSASRSTTGK